MQPAPTTPAGPLRTFGPATILYILITSATAALFWGDSVDYAENALNGDHFWEFGHLLWRPLGFLLAHTLLPLPAFLGGYNGVPGAVALFLAVAWLCGLGATLSLRSLLGLIVEGRWADVTTFFFVLAQAFLNYCHSGSSYVPGLCFLLLGCRLQAGAARSSDHSTRYALLAGTALAMSVLLWVPYVWALPAAGLLPVFLDGFSRSRLRLTLLAATSCAVVGIVVYGTVLIGMGKTSPEQARAWMAESQHGIARISGVARAGFGFPRSFVSMGQDGILFKRYLVKDPLNPVSLTDLLRLSLWKFAFFYVAMLALAVGLLFAPADRRLLGLLIVAAIPNLLFAISWQGGDMERYLALYPFLFVAVGGLLGSKRAPLTCRLLVTAFFVVAAGINFSALSRPAVAHREAVLDARARELTELPNREKALVLSVNDEVGKLRRDFPLNPHGHQLPWTRPVAEPNQADSEKWRGTLRDRVLQTWKDGGEVWVEKRLFEAKPKAEWGWVEGDDPHLKWADIHAVFKELEVGETIGGEDGFVRLPRSRHNQAVIAALPGAGAATPRPGATAPPSS
jgi:hypothetical protein